MPSEEHFKDIQAFIHTNEAEIAEEFGIFRTMTERDFFTSRLLKKVFQEKQKESEKKKLEEDDEE